MNGTISLYSACHPKDNSRNKSQHVFNTTCKERSQDFLKIEKCMIAYYNPDILRKWITLISLK